MTTISQRLLVAIAALQRPFSHTISASLAPQWSQRKVLQGIINASQKMIFCPHPPPEEQLSSCCLRKVQKINFHQRGPVWIAAIRLMVQNINYVKKQTKQLAILQMCVTAGLFSSKYLVFHGFILGWHLFFSMLCYTMVELSITGKITFSHYPTTKNYNKNNLATVWLAHINCYILLAVSIYLFNKIFCWCCS